MSVKDYIPTIRFGNKVGVDEVQQGSVVAQTLSTGAISVFGPNGLFFPIVITSILVVSQDTTAGNITVENPAGTVVATVAKGTTSGVVIGAAALSTTTVAAGTNLVVKSSSAGVGRVIINYIAG